MKPKLTDFDESELIEAFEYLDDLRESGRTNMWGASRYLEAERGFECEDASVILRAWMKSFDPDAPVDVRVEKALAAPVQP